MRSLTILGLAGLFVAGCGGDEPEPAPAASTRPPPVDTTLGDTSSVTTPPRPATPDTGAAPVAGQTAAERPSERTPSGAGAAGAAGPAAGRLYTVQVAAFENPQLASEWVGRLQRQGLPVWSSVAEVRGHTFHRVRVGAVPTVSEARSLGALLRRRYEWPVWVAPVTPAEHVPAGAVEQTRQAIGGD